MASSLSATWTCQECKTAQRGTKHSTKTGRNWTRKALGKKD